MKKLLILLLFPLMIFAQDTTLIGDVDCSGEVNSEDASLILQFVTNVINELPCQDNMTGLTPEQLQEIINMMDEQLSINYSGGGSSNYPIMISSISSETLELGEAFVYCNDLEEGGYTNWFVPNLYQLTHAISGGCELPDERTDTQVWSTTASNTYDGYTYAVSESTGGVYAYGYDSGNKHCRCVRFGEGETSEGSGNSSGPGSSILGNSEQPITMIGPMYNNGDFPDFITYENYSTSMYLFEAYKFCSQLEYDGYNDWFIPSHQQLENYIREISSEIIIPNQVGNENFFLRSPAQFHWVHINLEFGATWIGSGNGDSSKSCFCVR